MTVTWRPANVPVPPAHVAGLLAAVVLQRLRPLPSVRGRWLLAPPLCIAGAVLAAAAVRAAGDQHLAHPERPVTTGPYAVMRHPMYVAWLLLHAGVGTAAGSRWTAVTAPLSAGVVHLEAVAEERRLITAFQEEASRYLATTPRYLPGRRSAGWRRPG